MMNYCECIWRNNQTSARFASQFGHRRLDFTRVTNSCRAQLDGKRCLNGPKRMQVDKVLLVRPKYNGSPDNAGRHFFEHLQHFPNEREFNISGAGKISARTRQVINEAVGNGIDNGRKSTTNSGGAGNWADNLNEYFRDRHVYIHEDNDEEGRKRVQRIARALDPIAASVRVIRLPGLPPKGDVSDWLESDPSGARLVKECESTPVWEPTTTPPPEEE